MSARRGENLEGVNLLDLAPLRLARWEEVDGLVVLLRPAPRSLRERVIGLLKFHRVRLDEVGSHAWLHLDGRRTVAQVAAELRRRFGEAVEPAEERLGTLVRMLRRERFLAYPGWDEIPPGSAPADGPGDAGADGNPDG